MLELGPNGLEVGERWLPLKSKPTRADRSSQDSCSPPGFFYRLPFSISLFPTFHPSFYPTFIHSFFIVHCLLFVMFGLSVFVDSFPLNFSPISSSVRLISHTLSTQHSFRQLLCITYSHPLSVFILEELFHLTLHSF